jgi:hypothetical protein
MSTKWSNQHKRSRNHYGSAGGPLDNTQKARICILARQAHDKLDTYVPFEDWRQMEQFNAVGKDSLCDCIQSDYLRLVGHFQHLAGDGRRASRTAAADAFTDRRIAFHKLEAECAARGLELSYPGSICRKQFKCGLDEANSKQLWNLVFTVRNRRKAVKKDCPF